MKELSERTLKDLKRLEEINDLEMNLWRERQDIKQNCLCLNKEFQIIETLAYEYSPRSVCVVCGKSTDDLSIEQKIICFKQYFNYAECKQFTEEELLKMAKDGGYNFPSPYLKG